jgi:hypothetical protein
MNKSTRMMLLSVWLGAAVAHAQTQTPTQAAPATAPESPAGSSTSPATTTTSSEPAAPAGPQVQAEIVAVDAAGKTITVRESTEGDATDAAGKTPASTTLPVEGNAITRLGLVKAGSRVTLICAPPDTSTAKTNATTTESTSSAVPPAETDTSSKSPLNATCRSVVEIAKARATTTTPQQ